MPVQHGLEKRITRERLIKKRSGQEKSLKNPFEYSTQCDADIQFVVRIRKTGQTFSLTSNLEGWLLSANQLVC
jgi:hypothetical protein